MQVKQRIFGGLTALICAALPGLGLSQGSGSGTPGRLIDFDRARAVCVLAGAELLDAPGGKRITTLSTPTALNAIAITLDQNWIALQNGDNVQLAETRFVTFKACQDSP